MPRTFDGLDLADEDSGLGIIEIDTVERGVGGADVADAVGGMEEEESLVVKHAALVFLLDQGNEIFVIVSFDVDDVVELVSHLIIIK